MEPVKLTFSVGNFTILVMKMDLQTRASQVLFAAQERALKPILLPNERNYAGVESRFQWWFNTKKPLPELLNDFERNGFRYDGQINLKLKIERE